MVAACAARWNERREVQHAAAALRWMEKQTPVIIAPAVRESRTRYRLYVPDNVGDIAAASWSRGGDASVAGYRVPKDIRPVHLEQNAVHYLYEVNEQDALHCETLSAAARSITHLGWGVDMVAGDARLLPNSETHSLSGELWIAGSDGGMPLRVPTEGSFAGLVCKYAAFLGRVAPDGSYRPVPQLSAFRIVGYHRATDPPIRAAAAFSLLQPDASAYRPFDTVRQARAVAGMTRCAARAAAEQAGWEAPQIASLVLGHSEREGAKHQPVEGARRFAYLPLPSIELRGNGKARVVGQVRRVLVTSFAEDCAREVAWARQALSGQPLVDEKTAETVALLSTLPASDGIVCPYCRPASTWATVTPVVLPGYDDPAHYRRRLQRGTEAADQRQLLEHLDKRIEQLLRKAIVQAGFSEELAAYARLDWRKGGFWAGCDLAERYGAPKHLLRFPRYHVKLEWRDANGRSLEVPGPICLGGGRYYGLGLFAAC
jgi:CRISPR-associated protein Csb2